MFSRNDIASIDRTYFSVLGSSPFTITLRSNNTQHEWHLMVQQVRVEARVINSIKIYHRHDRTVGFHEHGHARTLPEAIKMIRDHDVFQLNGRNKE